VNERYSTLTIEELVRIWMSNRNNLDGMEAADEVMRRLYSGTHRGKYVRVVVEEFPPKL